MLRYLGLAKAMWMTVVAAVFYASAVGGFEIPLFRPGPARARLSPTLTSSHRSSLDCHNETGCRLRGVRPGRLLTARAIRLAGLRCRRRRSTRTTWSVMMAGPNKGKNPAFFANWPVLEAEIKCYLAERDAGVAPSNDSEPGKRNALLSYLSVDPVKMARENDPDPEEWEGELNVLSYGELARYGYEYLIEPMMKVGGYVVASERLGIALNERTLKDRQFYQQRGVIPDLKTADTDGFLTLGRAREERLDSVALRDRDEKRKSLFGKQAMMDKDARAIGKKAVTPKILSRSSAAPPTISVSNGKGEEPFRKPGLPEEYLGPTAWKAPAQDANAAPSQPLLLSMPQRAYAVGVVACCALAFGRGTSDALEKGFLSPDVVDVAGTASLFLVGLNVASAMAGAAIAKSKGRSVPLWAFKGSLAGLTSVCEVKGLPDFVLPATLKADDDPSAA